MINSLSAAAIADFFKHFTCRLQSAATCRSSEVMFNRICARLRQDHSCCRDQKNLATKSTEHLDSGLQLVLWVFLINSLSAAAIADFFKHFTCRLQSTEHLYSVQD